jgi:antitoxin component YwqK of YwqJK toxin-antitoxin module
MNKLVFFLFFLMTVLFPKVNAQVTSPPDSILTKVEGLKNVSAIKHIVNKYAAGKTKSEGWAYLFQDGNKTKFVRLGHWKFYTKDGILEFEDFMPVNDDLPIVEIHYDKAGVMTKKVLHEQEFDKNKNLVGKTYTQTSYFPNGNVKSRIQYKKGKKVGTWTWFDETGNVVNQKVYPDL